jgi:hypothetical protein
MNLAIDNETSPMVNGVMNAASDKKTLLDFLHKIAFDQESRDSIQDPRDGGLERLIRYYGFDRDKPALANAIRAADNAAYRIKYELDEQLRDTAKQDYRIAMGAITTGLHEEMVDYLFPWIW